MKDVEDCPQVCEMCSYHKQIHIVYNIRKVEMSCSEIFLIDWDGNGTGWDWIKGAPFPLQVESKASRVRDVLEAFLHP